MAVKTYYIANGSFTTKGTKIPEGVNTALNLKQYILDVNADTTGLGSSVALADGTVALPSLFFDSDRDSGRYWISANSYADVAGGAAVATYSTTGLAVTGTLSSTGAATVSGTLNYKAQVTDTGGAYATPVVLTIAQSGRCILVDDAAGLDFTLPAIAAGDVGTKFEFLVTVSVTSNNFRVTAATGDLLNGSITLWDDTAAYTAPQCVVVKPDFTNDLIMTMNGTTTGGKKGTKVIFTAVSATQWFVEGTANGSGVLATPFS